MAGHKKNKGNGSSASASSTPLSTPPSIIAQTIAQTLPTDGSAAIAAPTPVRFPPRSLFPGLGSGPRMHKAPRLVTAFDPPPVVVVQPAAEPPPPSSRRPVFEHGEQPTSPDRPAALPPEPPPPRAAPPRAPRREPDQASSDAPPFPVFAAPPFAAARANAYSEDHQQRERDRWGKNRHVPQPDTKLVHCWTAALVHFPPTALTLWLTRTSPAQSSYEIWISGEELFDPVFPDRKLYEVARRKRRQPTVAESFVGRIRGVSENGTQYDCGYGEIHFPPEEAAGSAPPWGSSAAMSPWGPAAGGPPGWGPPPWAAQGWGAPPGWGGPPPPWAQAWGGQGPPPAPTNVQSDPVLLQVWQASAEATANAQRASADSAARAADSQNAILTMLLQRVLAPAAPAAPAGGLRETIGMMKDMASLVETMRGPQEAPNRGVSVLDLGGGDRVIQNKHGDIDVAASGLLGVKGAITEIAQAIGKARAGRGPSMGQAPAAAAAAGALSGARMSKAPPPATPPAAAAP